MHECIPSNEGDVLRQIDIPGFHRDRYTAKNYSDEQEKEKKGCMCGKCGCFCFFMSFKKKYRNRRTPSLRPTSMNKYYQVYYNIVLLYSVLNMNTTTSYCSLAGVLLLTVASEQTL